MALSVPSSAPRKLPAARWAPAAPGLSALQGGRETGIESIMGMGVSLCLVWETRPSLHSAFGRGVGCPAQEQYTPIHLCSLHCLVSPLPGLPGSASAQPHPSEGLGWLNEGSHPAGIAHGSTVRAWQPHRGARAGLGGADSGHRSAKTTHRSASSPHTTTCHFPTICGPIFT